MEWVLSTLLPSGFWKELNETASVDGRPFRQFDSKSMLIGGKSVDSSFLDDVYFRQDGATAVLDYSSSTIVVRSAEITRREILEQIRDQKIRVSPPEL
jgi:hypothetical protein